MNKKEKQDKFLKLYEPIHDRFERFCRARVYGVMDYQDLINDTLLVAFDKLDTLKSEKAFLSFLFSISVRILSNKNKKRKESILDVGNEYIIPDIDSNTSHSTEVYFLHQAMAKLPEGQREALILFEISGFSLKEIVEIQGVSLSAVKQRLKRGREKLVEILNYESVKKEEANNG